MSHIKNTLFDILESGKCADVFGGNATIRERVLLKIELVTRSFTVAFLLMRYEETRFLTVAFPPLRC